jgi:hypothetical protein
MLRYEGRYASEVNEIIKDRDGWELRNPSSDATVDETDGTVRVAFLLGGIIDNWTGVVYDPTGEVLKVNGFELFGDEWREAKVTQLFGGDMTSARHLKGHWYLCTFT